MSSKRLFIGIPLSPEIQTIMFEELQEVRQLLRSHTRWVPSENYHFTLSFLGDTHTQEVEPIADKIREIAQEISSFSLKITKYHFYPKKRPRMLWASAQPHPLFTFLSSRLHRKLGKKHTPREVLPHITLARLKDTCQINDVVLPLRQEPLMTVAQMLVLWESVLSPQGAQYHRLHSIPLQS